MKLFYRLLLALLCPASFRNEYGGEMQSAFLARWRESSAHLRPWLVLDAIADIATAGFGVHRDLLLQDIRQSWRTARLAPAFTLTVLCVAALGVASSTAVFTVADHVLFRPLPFPDPQNIVTLYEDQTRRGYPQMDVSPANFRDWKRLSTCFEAIAAYRNVMANLAGGSASSEPTRISGAAVTFDLFRVLRVSPMLGRDFTEQDDAPGAPRTIVLSHRFWMQRFGGDAAVIGSKVLFDDEPSTVIGVMPPDFAYPRPEVKLWTAARMDESEYVERGNYSLFGVARLKPGVTLEQARAAMRIIGSNLEAQYPNDNKDANVYVGPLQGDIPNRVRTLIRVLGAAAGFLMLIACANLANLLLARSSSRRKEIEIRAALGAGRERLVRQLITESAVLCIAGGLAGVALAHAAVPLLARLAPRTLPVAAPPAIDWRVAVFAFAITLVTGIAVGVLPALRLTANTATLRVRGARADSARRSLVVVQIAASLALVLSTGLLVRALMQVASRDPGFETRNRIFFRTALPYPRYAETTRRENFYRNVLDGIRALPGVTGASVVSFRPMGDMRGGIWSVFVPGETRTDAHAASRFVQPGYFDVMGMRILAGRDFRSTDTVHSQRVAIVSESFVREHWPGPLGDAIGKTFRIRFGNLGFTVAGVVSDIRFRGMEQQQHEPQMYFASAQTPDNAFVFFAPKDFVVAADLANPLSLVPAIRSIVAKVDPSQPVSDVDRLEDLVESDTASRRAQVWVIAAFSGAALLLAAIGIHGLLSLAVSQRTQEIGLRRALGAQASRIVWIVFGEALILGLIGSGLGVASAYLLGRNVMQSVLAGVPVADPWTASAGVGFAVLLALAGSLAPTLRALRVDPSTALRCES